MYQLCFYVPASHLDDVKTALFEAGAGKVGRYDACAWETEGFGQFRPLEGSDAFLGDVGKVERVREYKVEMVCEEKYMVAVLQTLLDVHPYETPAYTVHKALMLADFIA